MKRFLAFLGLQVQIILAERFLLQRTFSSLFGIYGNDWFLFLFAGTAEGLEWVVRMGRNLPAVRSCLLPGDRVPSGLLF